MEKITVTQPESNRLVRLITNLGVGLAVLLAFCLPLLVLPFTSDFFEFNKQILFLAGVALMLVLWSVRALAEKRVRIIKTPLDLSMLLLLVAQVLGLIFARNRLLVATNPRTWVGLALPIFYFTLINGLPTKRAIRFVRAAVLASGSLLAFWTVLHYFLGLNFDFGGFAVTRAFSPIGGMTALAAWLLVAAILLGLSGWRRLRGASEKPKASTLLTAVTSFFLALVCLFAVFVTNPLTAGLAGKIFAVDFPRAAILDPATSWSVAIGAIREYPLFGVGVGEFANAFSLFRPIDFNNSLDWATRFGFAFNQWFQVLAESGLVGLAAWIVVTVAVLKNQIARLMSPDRSGIGFQIAILLLLLLSLATVWAAPVSFLLFLLLALAQKASFLGKPDPEREVQISVLALPAVFSGERVPSNSDSELLPKILVGPVILASLFAFYAVGRAYAAEIYYKKSLDAAAANQGSPAYNFQQQAIQANPFNAGYRLSYSQLNFALAVNLSSREELSEAERGTIQQLVQQGIEEGQVVTRLNPSSPLGWENLANLYRQLIGAADRAGDWAVSYYREAVSRDPVSPALRVNLGGVFYSLGTYEQAVQSFTAAASLKPDYANAYYNLANALREKGDPAGAEEAYRQALLSVEPGSDDAQAVESELDQLLGQGGEGSESPASEGGEELELSGSSGSRLSDEIEIEEEDITPESTSSSSRGQ